LTVEGVARLGRIAKCKLARLVQRALQQGLAGLQVVVLQLRPQDQRLGALAAGGVVLVAMGVAILLAAGFRFLAYGLKWYRRNPRKVWFHTPWLAFSFAMLMAAFGIALLVVLCVFRQ